MKGKGKWSLLLALVFVLSMFLSACSGGGGGSDQGSGNSGGESTDNGGKSGTSDNGGSSNEPAPKDQQVLHLAEDQDIPTLDANQITDDVSTMYASGVFAGLMRLDKDGNIVPDMAAAEPKVSKDQKTMTFKIRDDAKWSNGDPVTAQDFVFSWQREVDPKTGAQYSFIYASAGIKNAAKILDENDPMYGKVDKLGVKALDDHTLQVQFDNPQPFFKSLLWFGPFLPVDPKVVKKYGDKYATDADKVVYNGPFKLTEWKHGEGWTVEKNEDYWNADNYKLQKATFKIVKENSTEVNLYNTGKIDETGLSSQFVDQYKNDPNFKQSLQAGTFYLYFQEGNKALANQKIRTALYNGIDRKAMTQTLMKDGSVPIYSVVPKDFAKGPDGKDFRAKYGDINKKSLDEAKKLWKQGLKEVGMKSVTLRFVVPDNDPNPMIAEYIKGQLEKNFPGLKIKINKQPWQQYLNSYFYKKNYDLSLSGWNPDYRDPMTFLDIYTSDNLPQNSTGFADKKYDEMINKAKHLGTDPEKRWTIMQDAEKYLLDHAVIAPLFQDGSSRLEKPYVKDLIFPVYGPSRVWYYAWIAKH